MGVIAFIYGFCTWAITLFFIIMIDKAFGQTLNSIMIESMGSLAIIVVAFLIYPFVINIASGMKNV